MNSDVLTIGIDLGGTKLSLGVVNDSGEILDQTIVPTNVSGGADLIIDEMIGLIKQMQKSIGRQYLKGLGIAIAGQVDPVMGIVKFAPNLYWHNTPLAQRCSQALKIPVKVINDVRAAAWGEWHFGAGKGINDLVCLFIGTGIGGGIISNGNMLQGYNNSAGELGHMVLCLDGPLCTCGNKGCWEALAAGWGITQAMQIAVAEDPEDGARLLELAGQDVSRLSPPLLFQAVNEKDPLAIKLMKNVESVLVAGVTTVVNAFNPEVLIFGGGIIQGAPWLIETIDSRVRQCALQSATEKLRMVPASLPKGAAIIGAANIVRDMIKL